MILIAGPCVIDERTDDIAGMLDEVVKGIDDIEFYFKASFDKANRTSINSYRGVSIQVGLERLGIIRRRHGFRVTTDIHEPWQAVLAGPAVDVVQIPALLCRQTDLLVEAGKYAKAVNIKKGQFSAPEDMAYPVEKVKANGCRNVWLTERGASFGYRRLIVDMLCLPALKATGAKTICDCTHSLQLPGAAGGCSASMARDYATILARAAIAAGFDGVFCEVYDKPDEAKCDGPNSLSVTQFENLMHECLELNHRRRSRRQTPYSGLRTSRYDCGLRHYCS